jgi:hypothetical protein
LKPFLIVIVFLSVISSLKGVYFVTVIIGLLVILFVIIGLLVILFVAVITCEHKHKELVARV